MRHLLEREGLQDLVAVDSAGTSAYHAGEPPDPRSVRTGAARGVRVHGASRPFGQRDFHRFDYVLAMDRSNHESLVASAHTEELRAKVRLLRSFDPDAPEGAEVPDPYYGADGGFDEVFDICQAACEGLLAHLRAEHEL